MKPSEPGPPPVPEDVLPRRGDLFVAALGEVRKCRPVLVLSQHGHVMTRVLKMTTQLWRKLPVLVPGGWSGLHRASFVDTSEVVTVATSRLGAYVGRVAENIVVMAEEQAARPPDHSDTYIS